MFNVKFSPDGKRIVAGDYPGGVVVVWDVATGKQLTTIETGASYYTVSPDWQTLFAARLKTRKFERVEQDGKRMMRWTFDGEVRSWSLNDGKFLRTYKHQPPRGIGSVQLSPDGTKLVTNESLSGTYDLFSKSSISLWDVKSGEYQTLEGRQSFGMFMPDGRSYTSTLRQNDTNHDRAMKMIDVATGREKWSIPIAGKSTSVSVHAISQDGQILFGGLDIYANPQKWDKYRSWMKWWDAATGREIASFEDEKNGGFMGYRCSPDRQTLAVLNRRGDTRKLFLYSITERRLLRTIVLGEKAEGQGIVASGLTFHPDGKWLAVIVRSYPEKEANNNDLDPRDVPQPRILLIEAATGAIHETLIAPQSFASAACFSPDGRTLATDGHGRVLLWDMAKMPE